MNNDVDYLKHTYNKMLLSNEYITYKKYHNFLNSNKQLFLANYKSDDVLKDIMSNGYIKIDYHNDRVIERKILENKEYFDNMFSSIDENIFLDEEQRKAIVNEEDYTLIIAGAGAGKTTTMAAKVKYLIDKCHVSPSKIAVISYTNKATEELEDRIRYDFNLPVNIMTFHSLGIKTIRKIFKTPIKPISEKEQREVIAKFVSEVLFNDKTLLTQYIKVFNKYIYNDQKMFARGFVENYSKFNTFQEYFNDYKRRKQFENRENLKAIIENKTEYYLKFGNPKTLKDEVMRSKAEAKIANFLFLNGIEYKYEEPYPEKVDEERAYLPDFTIEVNGSPVYIEYFGLSSYYKNGSITEKDKKKYADLRIKKRQFHKLKNNNYIELDYKKSENGVDIDYISDLKRQLKKMGVKFKPLSDALVYDQILNNNCMAEFYKFVDVMLELIGQIKSDVNRENATLVINKYIKSLNVSLDVKTSMFIEAKLFIKVYNYYQKELLPKNRIDFSDMIYYANKYMKGLSENSNILDYDYLIIDEYQDISLDRYFFARNVSLISNAKVTAVGDDWQTIFSFAGSRIDLFLKYNRLFPGAKQLFINNTYRSGQELINVAGNFIMKNPLQIKKRLISNKTHEHPFKFYVYENNQYEILRYLIGKIYKKNKNANIMILARKNKHIKAMFETPYFSEGVGTRVISNDFEDAIIDAMSVHSAKGLSADEVIILNVTNVDFPCPEKEGIWLSNLFKPNSYDEDYPYAEDRRIFYVALTRTKNDVYLLVPKKPSDRSFFIDEIYKEIL